MTFHLFYRMKHSNIIYNAVLRMTLIDNSLIKDLEIAKNRKLKLAKIKNTTKVIFVGWNWNSFYQLIFTKTRIKLHPGV